MAKPLEKLQGPEVVEQLWRVRHNDFVLVSWEPVEHGEPFFVAKGGGFKVEAPTQELAEAGWYRARSRYFESTARKCKDCGEYGVRPLPDTDWLVCSYCGTNTRA